MVIKNNNYVDKMTKLRRGYSFTNKYEFECPDNHTAGAFLRVLHGFQIDPEDVTLSERNLDYSLIIFRVNRKTRLQIEYVFREFLHLDPVYLMEVDQTESGLEITANDGYIIF